MSNITTVQKLSSTPENTQGQQSVFQESKTQPILIGNLKEVLGAQGRLASLGNTAFRRINKIN